MKLSKMNLCVDVLLRKKHLDHWQWQWIDRRKEMNKSSKNTSSKGNNWSDKIRLLLFGVIIFSQVYYQLVTQSNAEMTCR